MKYGLIVATIAVVALFFFFSQSNKADAERLKQAEIAHQQKLESEKVAGLNKEYGGSPIKEETINKVVDAKMEKTVEVTPKQAQELNKIILEWADAATVAGATGRIALSQPVAKMQEIKRNISTKKSFILLFIFFLGSRAAPHHHLRVQTHRRDSCCRTRHRSNPISRKQYRENDEPNRSKPTAR